MSLNDIKMKLKLFEEDFINKKGSFASFFVLFDYYKYLKTNKVVYKILKEKIEYAENQFHLIENEEDNDLFKNSSDVNVIDMNTIKNLETSLPYFNELKIAQEQKKEYELDKLLFPFYLTYLYLVYYTINEAKNRFKNKQEQRERITKVFNKFLNTIAPTNIKKDNKEYKISLNIYSFFQSSILLVNNYIINKLEAEEFILGKKAEPKLSFNQEKSILTIKGQKIKIARKNDMSLDHYILDFIFSKDDLFEQADFSEIARDYLKEDYNRSSQRYFKACKRLNEKIAKDTNYKINDFLEAHSGKTGWCKINPKYL